ncbi:MAG: ComF family protein [Alphaproteobacteria bacterium]|nr:ComF family protein [Alphaproteobacteria bacterium]
MLDIVFPPECIVCDAPVGSPNSLCIDCWKNIEFISDPVCDQCGKPLEYYPDFAEKERVLCFECIAVPSSVHQARAVMIYGDTSKKLILLLKHGDRVHLARILAPLMVSTGRDLLNAADIIVPVPLHTSRLLHRRYNQASMLAKHVGKLTSTPVLFNTLRRVKNTHPQGIMSKEDRDKNIHNAFHITASEKFKIRSRNILLIDDVRTTGSTSEECARVLLENGANKVTLLTLARTMPQKPLPCQLLRNCHPFP